MTHFPSLSASLSVTALRCARVLVLSVGLGAALGAHALDGEVFATGFSQPLYLTAPTGDSRQFVVEKGGAIRVIQNGVTLATPFLNLSTKIDTAGERGLLGMSFDPNYATNGRFYVNYIDKTTLNTVVERYTVANPAGNVANAASGETIISIPQPDFSNHKGGWIGFRPGDTQNLYIGTGDGGSGNDPLNNAQNGNSLLGKMLRVNVSGTGPGYTISGSNPYVNDPNVRDEIWAVGLRNPFRNSFDRQTGDFWIADVGQGAREEINFESASDPGGHNYGWRIREGTIPTPGVGGTAPGLTDPIFDYPRSMGGSITGGYVYRGPSIAGADGRYFFGDYVSNRIFSFALGAGNAVLDLREDTAALLAGTGLSGIDSFGEDGLGRLYVVGINGVVVVMVPEPGTYALMLMGLAGVGWLARRRLAAAS